MVTITHSEFWDQVEKTDGCWLWLGTLTQEGYGMYYSKETKRSHRAHRLAFEITRGQIPDGLVIDHLCHVTTCVNPDHLIPATRQENGQNRGRVNQGNTSGFRGVSWRKSHQKWMAYAGINGERHFGGYFDNVEDANRAAIALRARLGFHQS